MFKTVKFLRWFAVLVSLAIEAATFWLSGPIAGPAASFFDIIAARAASASTWTWLGLVSLSLAWFWFEFSFHFFTNGRRIRKILDEEGGEQLVYETGLHWLALLRDIRTGKLTDGDEEELNAPLSTKGTRRSATWYAVWIPIWITIPTLLFFTGWIAWLAATFPATLSGWFDGARVAIDAQFVGPYLGVVAGVTDWFLLAVPGWLESFYALARNHTATAFGVLAGTWFALYVIEGVLRRMRAWRLLPRFAHFGEWLMVLGGFFALFATHWFDWLTPVYTFLPNNGPIAMGFFLLTISSMFYVPHIALYSSWRYALIRDRKSLDAALVVIGGIINYDKREVSLERIVDTHIHLDWWQRILGVGDIKLIETGGQEGEVIRHIDGPTQLDRALKNCIKDRRGRSGPTD